MTPARPSPPQVRTTTGGPTCPTRPGRLSGPAPTQSAGAFPGRSLPWLQTISRKPQPGDGASPDLPPRRGVRSCNIPAPRHKRPAAGAEAAQAPRRRPRRPAPQWPVRQPRQPLAGHSNLGRDTRPTPRKSSPSKRRPRRASPQPPGEQPWGPSPALPASTGPCVASPPSGNSLTPAPLCGLCLIQHLKSGDTMASRASSLPPYRSGPQGDAAVVATAAMGQKPCTQPILRKSRFAGAPFAGQHARPAAAHIPVRPAGGRRRRHGRAPACRTHAQPHDLTRGPDGASRGKCSGGCFRRSRPAIQNGGANAENRITGNLLIL